MIKITKNEAIYMRKAGYGEFVKKSYSKNPTYYLVEEIYDVTRWDKHAHRKELIRLSALNAYKKYLNSHVVKTVEQNNFK